MTRTFVWKLIVLLKLFFVLQEIQVASLKLSQFHSEFLLS
jgi:hypothetical protein